MKLINTIAVVVALMNLAVPGRGEGTAKTNEAPTIVEIVGGYGYLASMELKADGTFTWHGWEPGRKVASRHEGKLNAEELRSVVGLVNRVSEKISGSEFAGGQHSYTLILQTPGGRRREIRIRSAEQDQRPAELKALQDSLWATRSRGGRRAESEIGPESGS